jgi:hypothetical protein
MIAIFSYICISDEYSDLDWIYSIDGRKMVPVISPIQLAEIGVNVLNIQMFASREMIHPDRE